RTRPFHGRYRGSNPRGDANMTPKARRSVAAGFFVTAALIDCKNKADPPHVLVRAARSAASGFTGRYFCCAA
ncbi:hypothetical protein, partial [Sutterella wadsworthensis]|uniref:hypothetical protein n=1 Tax=Sutterella wadsworthensis TaxID=40545 RepID=UPI003966E12E